MPKIVYSVDLLFPTGNQDEPGAMHVKVMEPKKQIRLTIVVEVDPPTSIKENIASIMSSIQKDMCDRIKTDAKSEANVIFESESHADEFPGCKYVKLAYDGENYNYLKVDEIEY